MAPGSMRLRVLYFAKSRDVAGMVEEEFVMPAGCSTSELLAEIKARHSGMDGVLRTCVLALNHEYLEQGAVVQLKESDEVAVIPPLSGG